ncbi:HAD family hydrolase [Pseudomonas chlororaphis]|uniref:HAD family hydrolase n=1 Tax=Pseudomonas chlororaphis TaxID=587753 RepID=UPI001E307EC0|nr:hypothetical protein [Pseudomonas chlororaphis]
MAVSAVNRCGERYAVPPIDAVRYRALFDFPIADFYASLGFDLQRTPFAQIVEHYLEHFDTNVAQCPLHDGVFEVLEAARNAGIGVSIVSPRIATFCSRPWRPRACAGISSMSWG